MPQFHYEGVYFTGKRVSGTIDAANETEARKRLRRERIQPSRLNEKHSASFLSVLNRPQLKHVSAFTRQLSAMNTSGIPLVECLDAIAEQTEQKSLQSIVREVSSNVQSGTSLADALSRHPRVFNRLYQAMVRAGEAAGILNAVLMRLAEYQEKTVALQRRIMSAFSYPILVATVALGALVALFTFVVPTFSSMLIELDVALPLSTRIVITVSGMVKTWLPVAIVLLGGAIFTLSYLFKKNAKVRLFFDSFALKAPLLGDVQKKSAVSRFSRTFGALLNGGVPIAQALEITAGTVNNRILEQGFLKTLEAIRGGRPLAEPLKQTGVFPPMVIQMVAVGEKTGNLPEMLVKVADYYDAEVDTAISTLTAVLEPLLLVVMGVVIAVVLISMYLPMFQMIGSIG